ncbi:MAG: hypothetical protein KDA22_06650, partial [Phycisphaerales bacterium]|nr:hypothetical protein [Phycisphaerales bacterium]
MAKRHVHPALYEIIRSKNPGRSTPSFAAETGGPTPAAHADPVAGPVAGPTTVRVPIGYLWLAAALVVVALAGIYMVGYSLGERAADRRRAQFLEDRVGALGGLDQVSDPLVNDSGRSGSPAAGSTGPGR